jgi:hypothetical protein
VKVYGTPAPLVAWCKEEHWRYGDEKYNGGNDNAQYLLANGHHYGNWFCDASIYVGIASFLALLPRGVPRVKPQGP